MSVCFGVSCVLEKISIAFALARAIWCASRTVIQAFVFFLLCEARHLVLGFQTGRCPVRFVGRNHYTVMDAPYTKVADGTDLHPGAVLPPPRKEVPSLPNAQSPITDAAGLVALTDEPPPSGPPASTAGAEASSHPFTPPTTSGVVAAASQALAGAKANDVVDLPPAPKRALGASVARAPLGAPTGTPPVILHSSWPSTSTEAPPGGHPPAQVAGAASAAIFGPVPPVLRTLAAGGRTSSFSQPPLPSAEASAVAVDVAQSADNVTAAEKQEGFSRIEAEAMRHRRAAAMALVEVRRLRFRAQKQQDSLSLPDPLSTSADPHDGFAAAQRGARSVGDAALAGRCGAARGGDDGQPFDDAVPADEGLLAPKLTTKRRLWQSVFLDWKLQFEEDPKESIIDIIVAAPGFHPPFILLYASGSTTSNPPASRCAITKSFSRQLGSAVCGARPDVAPPLDRLFERPGPWSNIVGVRKAWKRVADVFCRVRRQL